MRDRAVTCTTPRSTASTVAHADFTVRVREMIRQLFHRSSKLPVAQLARYVWASPNTSLGLVAALAARLTGGSCRIVAGVLEVEGGLVRTFLQHCTLLKGGASAMALGHVVIARTAEILDSTRAHERIHVKQYERWGPFFLPAYAISSLLALARGQNAYLDNRFEREAYSTR